MRMRASVFLLGLGLFASSVVADPDWALLKCQSMDPSIEVRLAALQELGASDDGQALPIIEPLIWDADVSVRKKATAALCEVVDRRFQAYLAAYTRPHADLEAVDKAFEADRPYHIYGSTGKNLENVREAIVSGDGKRIKDQMMAMASLIHESDAPPEVDDVFEGCGTGYRGDAASALTLLVRKCPDLTRRLIRDHKTSIRGALLGRLASALHDANDLSLVEALYASPNITLRAHAISAAGEIGTTRGRAFVLRASTDRSVIVRVTAAESLSNFKDDEAIEALTKLAWDSKDTVSDRAVTQLGEVQAPKATSALLNMLVKGDERLAEDVAEVIREHPDESAAPALLNRLRGKANRRSAYISALSSLKCVEARDAVVTVATSKKDPDRHTALYCLESLGDKGIETILSILADKDEDPDALEIVAEKAGEMKLKEAVGLLRRLATHKDEDVRKSAISALQQLGEGGP